MKGFGGKMISISEGLSSFDGRFGLLAIHNPINCYSVASLDLLKPHDMHDHGVDSRHEFAIITMPSAEPVGSGEQSVHMLLDTHVSSDVGIVVSLFMFVSAEAVHNVLDRGVSFHLRETN